MKPPARTESLLRIQGLKLGSTEEPAVKFLAYLAQIH